MDNLVAIAYLESIERGFDASIEYDRHYLNYRKVWISERDCEAIRYAIRKLKEIEHDKREI